jgi:hypothetical protein
LQKANFFSSVALHCNFSDVICYQEHLAIGPRQSFSSCRPLGYPGGLCFAKKQLAVIALLVICLNNECPINLEGRYCGRRSVNNEWNSRCIHRLRPKHLHLVVSIGELIEFKRRGDGHDASKAQKKKIDRKKNRRFK